MQTAFEEVVDIPLIYIYASCAVLEKNRMV